MDITAATNNLEEDIGTPNPLTGIAMDIAAATNNLKEDLRTPNPLTGITSQLVSPPPQTI